MSTGRWHHHRHRSGVTGEQFSRTLVQYPVQCIARYTTWTQWVKEDYRSRALPLTKVSHPIETSRSRLGRKHLPDGVGAGRGRRGNRLSFQARHGELPGLKRSKMALDVALFVTSCQEPMMGTEGQTLLFHRRYKNMPNGMTWDEQRATTSLLEVLCTNMAGVFDCLGPLSLKKPLVFQIPTLVSYANHQTARLLHADRGPSCQV